MVRREDDPALPRDVLLSDRSDPTRDQPKESISHKPQHKRIPSRPLVPHDSEYSGHPRALALPGRRSVPRSERIPGFL
jgi:hypothetical protein